MVTVKFVRDGLSEDFPLPSYANPGDAGLDLCCAEDVYLLAGQTKLVSTGLKVILPEGYEGQVRSRSGLAARNEVFVLNSPGTIDTGYTGVVNVILRNAGSADYSCSAGRAIAQMVVAPITRVDVAEAFEMPSTARGTGGFGSTQR